MKITFETKLAMEEFAQKLGRDLCPSDLGVDGSDMCARDDLDKPVLCKDCWKMVLQEVEDGKENSDQ